MIKVRNNSKKILIVVLSSTTSVIIILGCIVIGITGSMPCLYTKCHHKAVCINHPFKAECSCVPGYAGNGKDHCDECGLAFFEENASLQPGRAVPYSWPATTLMQFSYATFVQLGNFTTVVSTGGVCGGTLINRKTILTSARCIRTNFNYYDPSQMQTFTIKIEPNEFNPDLTTAYQFFMGIDHYVYYNMDLKHVFHSGVEEIIKHEDFNETTLENDIAIVRLKQTIPLNDYIQITCLPESTSSNIPELNGFGYLAGFSTSGGTSGNWFMQNAEIDLYNSSMCNNVAPNNPKNWEKQFCGGEYDLHGNQTGFCHGDYGSSLYTRGEVNGKAKFITTGILSYDLPCSTLHSPAYLVKNRCLINIVLIYNSKISLLTNIVLFIK